MPIDGTNIVNIFNIVSIVHIVNIVIIVIIAIIVNIVDIEIQEFFEQISFYYPAYATSKLCKFFGVVDVCCL